jgi:hypothetical protein
MMPVTNSTKVTEIANALAGLILFLLLDILPSLKGLGILGFKRGLREQVPV